MLREHKLIRVVNVKRFKKKFNGMEQSLPVNLITFETLLLPELVKLAWYTLKVKPHVPNPMPGL